VQAADAKELLATINKQLEFLELQKRFRERGSSHAITAASELEKERQLVELLKQANCRVGETYFPCPNCSTATAPRKRFLHFFHSGRLSCLMGSGCGRIYLHGEQTQ